MADSAQPKFGRLIWPDLARGLAVVSMVVAHTCPVGGIFNVSEFLTAPWFALLIGVSLGIGWRHRSSTGVFVARGALRGLALFVVGLAVEPLYMQIDVVLTYLGALLVVLALLCPLVADRVWLAGGLALVAWAASPLAMGSIRGSANHNQVLMLLFGGHNYRVLTLCAAGLIGLAAAPTLLRSRRPGIQAVATLALAGILGFVGKRQPGGLLPYSGTWAEIACTTALALSATWVCRMIADRWGEHAWLAPLVATGRMSLTAYVLQLVYLAAVVTVFYHGGRDDHWPVMLSTIAVLIAFSWFWARRGWPHPIEELVRLPGRYIPS